MYTHSSTTTFSRAAEFLAHLPSPDALLPLLNSPSGYHHLMADQLAMNDLDSLSQLNSEMSYNSCSSGSSSYGSPSYGNQRPGVMQRSVSSHSLVKNGVHHPLSALVADLLESENGPVRRVYSTGDLQVLSSSPCDVNFYACHTLFSVLTAVISCFSAHAVLSTPETLFTTPCPPKIHICV